MTPRRNREIESRTVRLVGVGDSHPETRSLEEALALAAARDSDLVEVNPNVDPPICKLVARQPTAEPAPLELAHAPTPLVRAIHAMDRETNAFRMVHRLVDAVEVFVKFHTVAIVSHYTERTDVAPEIKGLLAAGLRTPSLGIWWQFAREIASSLRKAGVDPFVPEMDAYVLDGILFKEMEQADNLIALRNKYAHGATPADEECAADIRRYRPRFDRLLAGAGHLAAVRLVVSAERGCLLQATGRTPQPVTNVPDAAAAYCHLVRTDGATLSLHPLLVYRPREETFFFYNDLRTSSVNLLNYDECIHHRDASLRSVLLTRYPIEEWHEDRVAVETFRQKIETLTESFKGRREELATISRFLCEGTGFLAVWGGPGVGKSALLARAAQVLGWDPVLRQSVYPDLPDMQPLLVIISYFIRRDMSTNSADLLFDNLNRRIESRYHTGIPIGGNHREQAVSLKARLQSVSGKLRDNERLVLVLDGLDEATDADGLLENLPREMPPKVLVLLASRDHPQVREAVYEQLDRENKREITLGGLSNQEVRALLHDHVNKYLLETDYVEEVTRRGRGNPLYLKLLCDGIAEGDYDIRQTTQLPAGMVEIYRITLARLARVEGTSNLLYLLAAARDYLSPTMIASVLELSLDQVKSRLLFGCMEILTENPLTAHLLDYQLFHESLREYLTARYRDEIQRLSERLSDWCLRWETLSHELRAYALRFGLLHLAASCAAADAQGDAALAERRIGEICGLLDNRRFRENLLQTCGNGAPLRRGVAAAQRILVARDRDGSELSRITRYAFMMHEEPIRHHAQQIALLDSCGASGGYEDLARISEIAAFGEDPTARVLLVLRALWARGRTPSIPAILKSRVDEWLEEAGDTALRQLWEETLARA